METLAPDLGFDLDEGINAGVDEVNASKVQLSIQQRNGFFSLFFSSPFVCFMFMHVYLCFLSSIGRKRITLVQGLADDLDITRICKAFKRSFNCNGSVSDDEEFGLVIQLAGDHRTKVAEFLVDEQICTEDQIVIRGG